MTKTIIADSSPLIVFLKSDLEGILPELFDEIIVPEAVWQEVLSSKEKDTAKRKLPLLSWITRTPAASLKNRLKIIISGKAKRKR